MKDKEFKLIIDREKHEQDAKKYFSAHIDMLVDLVNYGSNLIPRAYDSSNKKLEDAIVIGVLFKHVVSMIDAISILVEKGATSTASLQARAAFEASLYIDWILESDSEKKAKYYYVSNLRNQRLSALRAIKGTEEEKEFSQLFRDVDKYIEEKGKKDLEEKAHAELEKIDNFLNQPGWHEINCVYQQKHKNTRWYQPLGIKSVKYLADKLGHLGMYELFYSTSSEIMHGASYRNHIQFKKGAARFLPIRQLEDINFVLRFITLVAIPSYLSILSHYRPGEDTLVKKYVKHWRKTFLNIPRIKYREQIQMIRMP